ncbi:MAG: hypothetical protein WCA92_21610, partial [Terriglobales bacterium]
MSQVDDSTEVRGKVFKRFDLAFNFAVWRGLARVPTGHILSIFCQKSGETFAAGNAFVSGDWRGSR